MTIMSLRVSRELAHKLTRWAKQEKKDKSTAARELIDFGWRFALLEQSRQGKLSIGQLARELSLSVSETMDFLARYGGPPQIDYEDYLKGLEHLRKVF